MEPCASEVVAGQRTRRRRRRGGPPRPRAGRPRRAAPREAGRRRAARPTRGRGGAPGAGSRAAKTAACRVAYTPDALRTWRASMPSSMNRASAAWVGNRAEPVGQLAGRPQGRPQRRRHHDEAEPERGKHGLRERADVADPPAGVEVDQRLQRPCRETELAVVVVLDHQCVVLLRPLDEGDAPPQRHGRARRELVRRRDVDQPGPGRQAGRRGGPPRLPGPAPRAYRRPRTAWPRAGTRDPRRQQCHRARARRGRRGRGRAASRW